MTKHDEFSTPGETDPGVGMSNAEGASPVVTARRRFLRRFMSNRAAVVALATLVLIAAAAALAPVLTPHSPTDSNLANALQGPSAEHWLGTDDIGRDIFSRMLFAGRISLQAAVIAVGIAFAIGVPLGLLSGYLGGRWDNVIMRLNDAMMSFPALILAITIIGFAGPSLVKAMVAVGIVFAPRFMRVVRGAALAVREETYIEAARMIGVPPGRIIRKHVLPNILSPLVVQVTLMMGLAILAEASLSFIGLGVQPPDASWGSMLRRAFAYLRRAPVFALTPGFLITLVVLSFNVMGDGLRDSLGREERRES